MGQLKHLITGDRMDANAYIVFAGLMGVVGWGINAVGYQLTPQTPNGVRPGFLFQSPQHGAYVTAAWLVVYAGFLLLAGRSVRRDVQLSAVGIVWIAVMALGFVGNTAAFFTGPPVKPAMMWLAWYGYFGLAYLATGLLVNRGGIYLGTGILSTVLFAIGLGAGLGVVPIESVGFAHPWPAPFVVLGLLHAVPMVVDGYRGGREMTDAGIPAVRAEQTDTEAAGTTGVIDAD